jgi:hypothetical protein
VLTTGVGVVTVWHKHPSIGGQWFTREGSVDLSPVMALLQRARSNTKCPGPWFAEIFVQSNRRCPNEALFCALIFSAWALWAQRPQWRKTVSLLT